MFKEYDNSDGEMLSRVYIRTPRAPLTGTETTVFPTISVTNWLVIEMNVEFPETANLRSFLSSFKSPAQSPTESDVPSPERLTLLESRNDCTACETLLSSTMSLTLNELDSTVSEKYNVKRSKVKSRSKDIRLGRVVSGMYRDDTIADDTGTAITALPLISEIAPYSTANHVLAIFFARGTFRLISFMSLLPMLTCTTVDGIETGTVSKEVRI